MQKQYIDTLHGIKVWAYSHSGAWAKIVTKCIDGNLEIPDMNQVILDLNP